MHVSFTECSAEDWPALMQFWTRVYRTDYIFCRSRALFDWQYGNAPASEAPGYRIKLALVDDTIAGCLGYIPVEVSLGQRVVRGAWAANWIIDPVYQRRALGPALMRNLMQQFEITLALGLSAQASAFLPRMGWTDFGHLARYVRVLDLRGAALLTENGRLDWPAIVEPAGSMAESADVRVVRRCDDGTSRLWDDLSAARGAGTRRSEAYLTWRYLAHPSFEYRLLEAHRNGRLTGVGVYRVEIVKDVPVRVGRIVELFAEENEEEALLRAMLEDARAQDVAVMDFFCSNRQLAPSLSRQGFLSDEHAAPAQVPVLFQPIVRTRSGIAFMAFLGNLPAEERPQRWYVTKSDGDQDRPN